jgi:tetratricopeptide (TPR) repeat protein
MRGILIGVAVLGCWLGAVGPARAGLYNSGEHLPPITPDRIRFQVGELKGIRARPDAKPPLKGSLRDQYLRQTEALEEVRKADNLSALERADLGACYIRQGRPEQAVRLLTAGDRGHFLVEANLAMAYKELGEWEMAVRHQQRALAAWQPVHVGFSRRQLAFSRHVEDYFLRLLRSRLEETRRGRGRGDGFGFGKALTPVDPLFPGLRYVGPDLETYEAGNLAPEMVDRLPPAPYDVLLQLVVWDPWDARLYWQLAEMLNARGHVEVAAEVLKELGDSVAAVASFQDFAQHRRILLQAVKDLPRLIDAKTQRPRPEIPYWLLTAITPRGGPAPLAGLVGQEVAAWAPVELIPALSTTPPAPNVSPPEPQPPSSGLPDWRHVTIGFASGFVVAALLGLQWQEWKRRRQAAAAFAAGAEGGSPPEAPADPGNAGLLRPGG